jgi:superfamily II DNA or RNA helicase
MVTVSFVSGTLDLRGVPAGMTLPWCAWDPRTRSHRAPASAYADVLRALARGKVPFDDRARAYEELELAPRVHREPRPYQAEAVEAWERARGRGVVVLPTGAGKTHVAVMALERKPRSALVVAPTLDLVRQWYDLFRTTFGVTVGVVGGGSHEVRPLTVTTYDSAYLHMEHYGARFGLVIFDECHHLPSEAYTHAARACLAPYRLGLTATPERTDGREAILDELVGPCVFRKDIGDLAGSFLAEYDVDTIYVDLTPEERAAHDAARATYRAFVVSQGIRMNGPEGWAEFVKRSARSTEGRRAMEAYRVQRRLAFAAPAKLDVLEQLLSEHAADRAIVFTQDNATAHEVSRRFLVPVITHQTRVKERSAILAGLRDGTYGAVATSKVLNEGVDVPEANVAIVLSGSGSVREHVQRLGRVLRKKDGKRAVLYELVTAGSSETMTSERRRDHVAYR